MNLLLVTTFTLTLLVNGLLTKFLIMNGLKGHELLILSGLGSLVCVVLQSMKYSHSLNPQNKRKQFFRALLAGGALYLITASYEHLSATSVSLVSRTDLALLILLGPLAQVPSKLLHRVGAAVAILFILGFIGLRDEFRGVLMAFSGTVAITAGYLFIKASMKEENTSVSILTPSLAILAFGSVIAATASGPFLNARPWVILGGVVLGALMFLIYRLTMKMYALMDIASAEYPTLVASGLMLPLEIYFFRTQFPLIHVLLIFTFIFLAGAGIKLFSRYQEA